VLVLVRVRVRIRDNLFGFGGVGVFFEIANSKISERG
jgi:hypothetical protein